MISQSADLAIELLLHQTEQGGSVEQAVLVGDASIGVANVEGEFFAFADVCTHDDGPVAEGELDDHIIECPRHGAKFDVRTGAVRQLPAVVPIPVYDVKIDGDTISVSKEPTSLT